MQPHHNSRLTTFRVYNVIMAVAALNLKVDPSYFVYYHCIYLRYLYAYFNNGDYDGYSESLGVGAK